VSASFASAVVIGSLVTAINLRTAAWAMKKMFESGRDGKPSAMGWSLLLAVKLVVLIAVVWVLLAYVNVNAVGFAIGLSLFMPAIGWQMVTGKIERRGSEKG
jgi:small-conductance mechanosensitive channel